MKITDNDIIFDIFINEVYIEVVDDDYFIKWFYYI